MSDASNNIAQSVLFGAPEGWSSPTALYNWNPPVDSMKGKPAINERDNQGHWSLFTFGPLFETRVGKYICHAMPACACPVPVTGDTGKEK